MMKKKLPLLTLVIFAALLLSCQRQAETATEVRTGADSPVLLISVDGLMNEYLERNDTPNFDRLIDRGVQAESLIPVFPSKTFPTHFSMATGLFPENHGVISNSFYDPQMDETFSYGPPEGSPNDERWWGGEPIWTTVEKQGMTSATMFWPGSEASIDGVQPTRWVDYDGGKPNRSRIDSVARWLDPSGPVRADLSTLYFSDVDSEGHSHGPDSRQVDQAVQEADALIGYLLERLEQTGLWPEVNIIIVSDHGMAELSKEKVIILDELIDLDDVRVIDWNPVAMLSPQEGRKDQVYENLKQNEENYRVYYREELPERYRFRDHYRIPEILMVADIPYTITTRSRFDNQGVIAGQHGYDPLEPEMQAVFIAAGPDVQQRDERVERFQMVHLYEMMAGMLDIDPAPNDGHPDSTRYVIH